MTGALPGADRAPSWLQPLVTAAGEVSSRTFTRFQTPPGFRPRPAAVLMLFSDERDVLLLRRADSMSSHAGQVAFPGGRSDDGDGGPVGTALREAVEETGLDPSGVRPLAVYPELWVPVSNHSVAPVLAHWHTPSAVHAVDPAETAAVMRVPVAQLADPANRFQVRRAGFKGPAFDVDGTLVWGFTAGVLSTLLELAGWQREWDMRDVRSLDVALRKHNGRQE